MNIRSACSIRVTKDKRSRANAIADEVSEVKNNSVLSVAIVTRLDLIDTDDDHDDGVVWTL